MEGKSGLFVVMLILSIVLLVGAVAFGVLYGVKQTMVFDDNNMNLVVSLICGGLFVLSQIGLIVANNARITADNTYDILCRIDALLKEKGLTDADLARRDLKVGEKIAKKEAELKAKLEAKALKTVNHEEKLARIEEAKQDAVAESVAFDAKNMKSEETVEAPVAPAKNESSVSQTYSFEEWKKALDGKITCGECGGNYIVSKTKSGKIALVCLTSRRDKDKCSSKPISTELLASKFVEYVHVFFGDDTLNDFDIALFEKAIDSVTIKGGEPIFKANEAFVNSIS